jgi:release factor glutamine methyltransferase
LRTVLKHIVSRTYKPLLVKYLSKTRTYRHGDILLQIPPQVFHPGFFFSTKILLRHVLGLSLQGKSLLELGAGSGLIAFSAKKKGSLVTASDINPVAIEYLHRNGIRNNISLRVIESDLFNNISKQSFDIITINPPYYKKKPVTLQDHAWYCGENGEYFQTLFQQLGAYTHLSSIVLMILCDGCDIQMIESLAAKNRFAMSLAQTKQNLLEKNFIYQISKVDSTEI